MKRWGIFCLITALCAAALLLHVKNSTSVANTIEIGGQKITIEIADTDQAREKGLGGRDSLLEDGGMLFIFPEDGVYSFWMKDMRFPIDIMWLSADGRIVDLLENVSPDTYPTAFSPKKPARYVLELPANTVKRLKTRLGDIVRL